MAERTVVLNILGNADSAREAMQGLEGDSDSLMGKLGNLAKNGIKVATGAAIGLGGALAGAAMKTASHADDVAKNAREAGISTEAYQELEYALGQAGIEQDTMNRILGRNTQRLGRAAEGNEKYADAYEDLGVNIHDANGELRSSEDVMDDVMVALADIEDPAVRAARAGELLGTRAGRELAGALDDGIEGIDDARQAAHDLGIVLGDETMDQAEAFNDAWDDVQRAMGGMVHQVGAEVLPGLVPLFEMFAKRLPGALETVSGAFNDHIIPAIRSVVEWVTPRVQDLAELFIERAFPAIRTFATDGADFLTETLLPGARRLLDFIQPRIQSLADWFLETALPAVREFANDTRDFLTGTVLPAAEELLDWLLPKIEDLAEWFTDKALPAVREFANDVAEFFTDTLLPAAQDLFEWIMPKLEDFAEWFVDTGIPGALDAITDAFGELQDRVEPVFDMLKENKDAVLVGMAAALTAVVVPAFIAWTAATLANAAAHLTAAAAWALAYLPIIAILAAVGVAAALLYKAWDTNFMGIRDILQGVWDFIQPILESLWERLSEFIDDLLPELIGAWESVKSGIETAVEFLWNQVIKPIFENVKSFIEDHADTIKTVLEGAWEIIESSITTAIDVIEGIILGFLKLIQGDWEGAWDEVKGIADSVWDHLKTVFGNVRDFVVGAFETIKDRTVDTVKGWSDDIEGFVSDLRDDVIGFLREVRDRVTGFISDMVGETWETVKGWVEDVVGKAKELYEDVTGFVEELVSDVIQFYLDLAQEVWEAFKDLVEDLVGKTKELYEDVTSWVEDLFNDVVQFYADLATEVWESFRDLVNDLVSKTNDLYDDVTSWVSDLVSDVVQFYLDLASDVWESFRDLVDDLVQKTNDLYDDVTSFVSDLYNDVTTYFSDLARDVWDSFRDLVDDLVSKADDLWRDVTGFVEDLYRDGVDYFTDLRDDANDRMDDLLRWITDKADDIKDAVLDPFRDARDTIGSIVRSIGNNVIDQLNNAGSSIVSWVNKFAGAINWVANELGLGDIVGGYTWNDIPRLHTGTKNFAGGPAILHNEEMVMLPQGSRVFNPSETRAIQQGVDGPGFDGKLPPGVGGGFFSDLGDRLSGAWDAVTDFGRDLIERPMNWVMDQVIDRFDLGLSLPGSLGDITGTLVSMMTDALRDFISSLRDRVLEEMPVDDSGAPVSLGGWHQPTRGVLTQRFGHTPFSRSSGWYGDQGHTGIDIANSTGTPIWAANDGSVGTAGWGGGFGNMIILRHADNLRTLYAHLSRIMVRVGELVSGGEQIGAMGSTGASTGPHLHFELHRNGVPIDPSGTVPFANGGTLPEDIFGVGPSGTNYMLHQGEEVIPRDRDVAPVVNFYGDIHIDGDRNDPSGALDDAAWAATTALRRRGMR